MFDVMITMTFRKSTLRPCESVSFPSSRICRRMLNTSGCAFSISSKSTTEYGLWRTAPGGWPPWADPPEAGGGPALVGADVAGGGCDEPRHGVLLHVLRHVDLDHRVLVREEELGERACKLRFADAGRAEEDEGRRRPLRILDPGAGAADRLRDGQHGFLLAHVALVQLAF